ncbi:MAG: methionyl-tRNA formyltransferase [bacterium]|nr:methionyl-tRNA formyltransferase [bacterium]
MRIIFMGTPDFSVPTLSALLESGHEVIAVYSQPPRPAGRGKKDRLSPVHLFAQEAGLEVRTPVCLRKLEARKAFETLQADVAIVVAYGLILGPKVLAAPKHGCFNLHGSLLPRWRGAAPIQRAIMAGDKISGVEVMRMETGLDTGPVCMSTKTAITPNMNAGELHDDLMVRGASLMAEALKKLQEGSLSCIEQPVEGITYASKIEKSETHIDWNKSASQVHNHIRGLSPFPGAWFEIEVKGKNERIKVLSSEPDKQPADKGCAGQLLDDQLLVACSEGAVRLVKLQRAGKRPMKSVDFLRGLPIIAGKNLK